MCEENVNHSEYSNEIGIQDNIFDFLSHSQIPDITNEWGKGIKQIASRSERWKHNYILGDDFIAAIERLNPDIFNCLDRFKIGKDAILECIWHDFTGRYDNCGDDNQSIYNLFINDTLSVALPLTNGELKDISYSILDKNLLGDCNQNVVRIIREQVLLVPGTSGNIQYPDFSIYCNGLPFFIVEVKNPLKTEGLRAAYEDYLKKATYHKFIGAICTDGSNMSLVASNNLNSLDIWRNYGSHKKENDTHNGLYDFITEIVLVKRNLILFMKYCFFPIPIQNNHTILATARVQQYFAMKKVYEQMLERKDERDKKPFRYLIKHPPRSGKTITSRFIVHMMTDLFSNSFEKIFIQAPDTTITNQFLNDFRNFGFGNNRPVVEITRRYEKDDDTGYSYEKAITEKNSAIYVMNMQKMADMNILNNDIQIYDSAKVLFLIDEVHTHQQELMATQRTIQFPNASYITFTATPRMKNNMDMSLSTYSTIKGYLDELTNEDARGLDIVVPVLYKKLGYEMTKNSELLQTFGTLLRQKLIEKIGKDTVVSQDIENRIETKIEEITKDKNYINLNEFEDAMKGQLINEYIADGVITTAKEMLSENNRNYIVDKFKFLIDFMNKTKSQCYKQLKKPKAFFVVDSQETANFIMDALKSNIIDGYRIGVDYSSKGNNQTLLEFNQVDNFSDIIKSFSSEDQGSIDILVVVEKYLKGYNNKYLCYIFCDCSISEPSKIFQLYTRPGTKCEGKPHGYFIDMSLDDKNYKTMQDALKYYEEHEKIYTMLITDEQQTELTNQLNNKIKSIARKAGFRDLDTFRIALRRNGNQIFTGLNLSKKIQKHIIKSCREMNVIMKRLGHYSNYGISNYIDIIAILKGMGKLLATEKGKKLITKQEAGYICREIMDQMELKSIDQLIDIQMGELYDRNNKVNGNNPDIILKELKIRINTPIQITGSGNIEDTIKRIQERIEQANHGRIVDDVREWYNSINTTNRPDYDKHEEAWKSCYDNLCDTIETMEEIQALNILDENKLNEIRRILIEHIKDEDLGREIFKYFADTNMANANDAIKNAIYSFRESLSILQLRIWLILMMPLRMPFIRFEYHRD